MTLRFFKPAEFWREDKYHNPVNWYEKTHPKLLYAIDLLRWRWSDYCGDDTPIRISPHGQAIGRQLGHDSVSDHNIDRWGLVRGIDLMPVGLSSAQDAAVLRALAVECGIDAIGIYPDWAPAPGIHVGIRPERDPGDPALWGAIRQNGEQVYTAWTVAAEKLDAAVA